jgi:hypothetical protein
MVAEQYSLVKLIEKERDNDYKIKCRTSRKLARNEKLGRFLSTKSVME